MTWIIDEPSDKIEKMFLPVCNLFLVSNVLLAVIANTFLSVGNAGRSHYYTIPVFCILGLNLLSKFEIPEWLVNLTAFVLTVASISSILLDGGDRWRFYLWFLCTTLVAVFIYASIASNKMNRYFIVYYTVSFIGSISYYGTSTFEIIKPNFGGGAPLQVRFYLSNEVGNDSLMAYLDIKNGDKMTKEMPLYLESEDAYLIKVKQKYVKLSKSFAQGYVKEK